MAEPNQDVKEVEKQVQGQEEDEEVSYGDMFGKWAREKLRISKKKIKEVD